MHIPKVLTNLIDDPNNTDIIYTSESDLIYDNNGQLVVCKDKLTQSNAMAFINFVASKDKKEINLKNPILETYLVYKNKPLRLEATITPITKMLSFTIRIPSETVFPLEQYLGDEERAMLTEAMNNRLNIVIAGSTGSGKTSLLKSILKYYYQDTTIRVLLVEDTPEITFINPYSEIMRTHSHIDLNDLTKVALRSRPDQIMVGEVRGKEAYDLLKAWNTGHNGITSLHATSIEDIAVRLNWMMNEKQAGDYMDYINDVIGLYVFVEKKWLTSKRFERVATIKKSKESK